MSYLEVAIPADGAQDFVHEIGKVGCLMMTDMNKDTGMFQRAYSKDIVKLQELGGLVDKIEARLDQGEVEHDVEINEIDLTHNPRRNFKIETLSAEITGDHKDLEEQFTALENLAAQYNELRKKERVYLSLESFLAEEDSVNQDFNESHPDLAKLQPSSYQNLDNAEDGLRNRPGENVLFKWVSGTLHISQKWSFHRQLFLVTRGNCYVLFGEESDDSADTETIPFMVYFLGERFNRVIRKLCTFMEITIYVDSEDTTVLQNRNARLEEFQAQMRDLRVVLTRTERNIMVKMRTIAVKLKRFKVTIAQEKAIRVALNNFRLTGGAQMVTRGWCAEKNVALVSEAMDVACDGKGMSQGVVTEIDTNQTPPTFFDLNKFTQPFQNIIDTYGTPRYREYNPTVPTLITFPFLFAMMYGDMFHGSCIFLLGVWLVWNEERLGKQKLNELMVYLYGGRYIILLMGLFAIYTGFLYNEVLSLSLTIWSPSAYNKETNTFDGVYPFGIDPTWKHSQNEITFVNSYKMKMAVIFGVTQMSYGLCLSALNHVEYGDMVSLFFEWSFQVVFMVTFFVYMDFCIIYKWATNWIGDGTPGSSPEYAPPSIITILVEMVLGMGSVEKNVTQLFPNINAQKSIEIIFLIMMLLSIPCMLLLKPFVLWWQHKRRTGDSKGVGQTSHEPETVQDTPTVNQGDGPKEYYSRENGVSEDRGPQPVESGADEKEDGSLLPKDGSDYGSGGDEAGHGGGHGHGHGEFEFGEVMIHQVIHTIEYVLGTVSNTASYLRLWALSLAHSELATVFYNLFLTGMMQMDTGMGWFMLLVAMFAFWGATVGVLLVMDQLECFLHALRLHWVEFQNKFYYADGLPWEPFSYKQLVIDIAPDN